MDAVVEELALHRGAVRTIRAAHLLKTLLVGLEESRASGNDLRPALPLCSALAFVAVTMNRRGMVQIAREVAESVREGRRSRRLTS